VPTGDLVPVPEDSSSATDESAADDALLLMDLYRDVGVHLAQEIGHERSWVTKRAPHTLPLELLDAIHRLVQETWVPRASPEDRQAVSAAYATHRRALVLLAGVNEPVQATVPVVQ
jgi:hypothetical protein